MTFHLRSKCCLTALLFTLCLLSVQHPRFGVLTFETGFTVTEYESRPHVRCSRSRIAKLYGQPSAVDKLIKRCASVCLYATPATCIGFNIPASKNHCELVTNRCKERDNGGWHYYRKPESRPESKRYGFIVVDVKLPELGNITTTTTAATTLLQSTVSDINDTFHERLATTTTVPLTALSFTVMSSKNGTLAVSNHLSNWTDEAIFAFRNATLDKNSTNATTQNKNETGGGDRLATMTVVAVTTAGSNLMGSASSNGSLGVSKSPNSSASSLSSATITSSEKNVVFAEPIGSQGAGAAVAQQQSNKNAARSLLAHFFNSVLSALLTVCLVMGPNAEQEEIYMPV